MDSSNLFSHSDQSEHTPNDATSAEPVWVPVFSDRPNTSPGVDAPRSP